MNNIANQFPQMGLSHRKNHLPDFQSSTLTKEQSLRSRESLDTGLVIETKEGDKVTLSSNSFNNLDAYMYDSKGVLQTDSGTAAFSETRREITLASGQSFTFIVEGDLSEAELEDIDAMLQGLDGVIEEMMSGDMEGAVSEAMHLGEFDTFNSFAADISYQRYTQLTSAVSATTTQRIPAEGNSTDEASSIPAASEKKNPGFLDIDKFLNKLLEQMDKFEKKQVVSAKSPIDKLFEHHLDQLKEAEDASQSIRSSIEDAMARVDSLIGELMTPLFENELSAAKDE